MDNLNESADNIKKIIKDNEDLDNKDIDNEGLDNKDIDGKDIDNKDIDGKDNNIKSDKVSSIKTYKIDRNNTNFSIQLLEYIKKISPEEKYKFLKYYQNIVREYVMNVDVGSRGLLVAHTMGMGKSMVATAVAMDMIDAGYEIIILTTKSLHENMRNAIKKYIKLRTENDKYYKLGLLSEKDLDEWINRNYSFVSMNASNMLKQMSAAARSLEEKEMDKKFKSVSDLGTLDGKVLIVDEAHNLFRAITNGSKNALGLYNVIMTSKRVKLIFLTGTPIASDPFELVPCFNMLARRDGKPILPEDWKTFHKLYVNPNTGHIINKEKFQNRIFGLVSYVDHKSIIQTGGPIVEFPEELKPVIKFVNMSRHQYVLYTLAREKEKEEGKIRARYRGDISNTPLLQKPRSDTSGSYRVRSRQLSNYAPPSEFSEYILGKASKRKKIINIDNQSANEQLTDEQLTDENSANEQLKDNQLSDKKSTDNTSTDNIEVIEEVSPIRSFNILDEIKDKDIESPKLSAILETIEKQGKTLGIVYSQFIGVGGLGVLQRFLIKNGYKLYKGQSTENLKDKINQWLTVEEESKSGGMYKHATVELYPSLLSNRYKKEKVVETSSKSASKWKKYVEDIRKNISNTPNIKIQPTKYTKISYEKKKNILYKGFAEKDTNNKQTSKAADRETSKAADRETSKATDRETSKAADREVSKVANKQTSKAADREVSKVANKQISKAADREVSKAADREVSKVADKEVSKVADREVSKVAASKKELPSRVFAMVYGDIKPEERDKIQRIFNSDENKHGEIISLILLSSTGAEGLDLKNVRHVHIMEPYWNYSRLDQVKYRAIRGYSHIGLPENERNVSTYIYLSIRPDDTKDLVLEKLRLLPSGQESKRVSASVDQSDISDDGEIPSVGIVSSGPIPVKESQPVSLPVPLQKDKTDEGPITTDIKLFKESIKNNISIKSFTQACQEVSIECQYNAELSGMKHICRICQPNNSKLFSENPEVDVKGTDRCSPVEEKTVKAKKIKINGETYYWIENPSALYGFKIYELDKSINGYREVSESSGMYIKMQEELQKSKLLKV